MEKPKRFHKNLSLMQRETILELLNSVGRLSLVKQSELIQSRLGYSVSKSTLHRILKTEDQWRNRPNETRKKLEVSITLLHLLLFSPSTPNGCYFIQKRAPNSSAQPRLTKPLHREAFRLALSQCPWCVQYWVK